MKKIFAANWKLNKTPLESKSFCEDLLKKVNPTFFEKSEIFIFPQNFSVGLVSQTIKGSGILVGPQNIHFETKGAFTGENSAELAAQFGCQLVLLGHSERRQYFHENGNDLNKKIKLTQKLGLTPVYCIGESLTERQSGQTEKVCFDQLESALTDVNRDTRFVVAYEPVWAIGTGQVATVQQVADIHKKLFVKMNELGFKNFQLLYGGSVKPDNSKELLQIPHVDGFLIGGASLEVSSFSQICGI